MACLLLLIASPFLWGKVHTVLGIVALVAAIGLGIWAYVLSREPRRDRLIRLLLGLHEWGSSDPATWCDRIVKDVVDPKKAFWIESFRTLAEQALAGHKWAEAMWAARLCTVIEDSDKGEALTDSILQNPKVAERLRRVDRKPASREEEFGEAPALERWVVCNPADHIVGLD